MESSARLELLNSFMERSHGKLESLKAKHEAAMTKDPLFYGHLARWYQQHGCIRDHHELFPAHLLSSPHTEMRVHGFVLAQTLRPYQMARLARYSKEQLRYPTRALRQTVAFYLRRREQLPEWMDECIIRDRRSMKYLYATFHLKPDARTQSLLFDEANLYKSRVSIARQLAGLRHNPRYQADLIQNGRIHFTTAIGSIQHYTPEVLSALVYVMTPQQMINHLVFLEKRGALQCPEIRQTVLRKIKEGVNEGRVNDMKSFVALRKLQADQELSRSLFAMTEKRLQARGRISVPTALFIDKSGSMDICIDIGKQLAAMISTVCEADLFVEAFDGQSFSIIPKQRSLEGWEEAFRFVRADGCTSIGCSLHKLSSTRLQQIVVVSDGEENTPPLFSNELQEYRRLHGRTPDLFLVKVSNKEETNFEKSLRLDGFPVTVIPFNGDYYNLPNLVPRLCQGVEADLVREVLAHPLYQRTDLDCLPPGFEPATCEIL